MNEIDRAKITLRDAGFFTGNLWSVEDVKHLDPQVSDDEAQGILLKAMTNPATMEQIWLAIKYALDE